MFTQEDGKSLHVLMGDDGLPERAHAEGYTFLFDNYQNNAVVAAWVSSGVRRPDTRVHRRDQAHRSP